MTKKTKRPLGRKLRRNPHARALAGALFRKRVVKRKDEYRRREKHAKPVGEDGEG
jgi:hypothetical protein